MIICFYKNTILLRYNDTPKKDKKIERIKLYEKECEIIQCIQKKIFTYVEYRIVI